MMVEEAQVMEALQTVEDPELDISIVELGLVYAVRFEDRDEGKHAEIQSHYHSGHPRPTLSR